MKKIIIGTLGALFASAIAVAVWSSNVRANDLLASNIEALAGGSAKYYYEGGVYEKGGLFSNWKDYYIHCVVEEFVPTSRTTTTTTTTEKTYSQRVKSSFFQESISSIGSGSEMTIKESTKSVSETKEDFKVVFDGTAKVCGDGEGSCYAIAKYGNNPCKGISY